MVHEVGTVEVPAQVEVKHKMLFPQMKGEEEIEAQEEDIKEAQRELPLPPPPRMRKRE